MQEELPGLSVELGGTEHPHPTSSDLSHLGESRCQPYGELQPDLCTGKRGHRTPSGLLVTQQRRLEQGHPSTSRYEGPRTPSPEEELVLHTSPLPVQLANDPDCRAAQGTRTGCPCPSWGWHSHQQGLPWSPESRVSAGGAGSPQAAMLEAGEPRQPAWQGVRAGGCRAVARLLHFTR